MRVCILILYTKGWSEIANIVLPNLKEYCLKHGYAYDIITYNDPYPSDFGFNKLIEIKRLFNDAYDIVWSLDLDTLITNHDFKVEDFISDGSDFFITKDVNGINAGSFIIRNSSWSLYSLDSLLEMRTEKGVHCEQDAMVEFLNKYGNQKIKVLPHPSINSYKYELYPEFTHITSEEAGQWKEGNFVLHLPGLSIDKRIEILKQTPITK